MLDNLTQRLSRVVKTLRGEARLTEANTQEMLREVRMALRPTALPVVREFVARVKDKALGEEVAGSLSPGQALVGVVHKELTALMGGDLGADSGELSLAVQPPAVILMAGLQGAGKTTTTGKLARWLSEGQHTQHGRKTGKKKVLVVSADVYRPAAIEQLKAVAAQVGVDFLPSDPSQKPEDIARNAIDHARRHHYDVLILDTAGRLGIDEAMMREIRALHDLVKPVETLFVVDAMQGQDAVNTARAFADALPLTGVVLTKLDGDARGGAACRCATSPASRSSSSASRKSSTAWSRSIPSAWRSACWASTSCRWSSRRRRTSTSPRRRSSRPRSSRATSST